MLKCSSVGSKGLSIARLLGVGETCGGQVNSKADLLSLPERIIVSLLNKKVLFY